MVERLLVLVILVALASLAALSWRWIRRRQVSRLVAGAEAAPGRPTLLYFWAEWCTPCRYQQAPIIESLRAELADRVAFRAIDAGTEIELTRRYGVLSVPTTVVISSTGRVIARNTGVTDGPTLRRQLTAAT